MCVPLCVYVSVIQSISRMQLPPLLAGDDKEVVEEEEEDGCESGPKGKKGATFSHILQLAAFL